MDGKPGRGTRTCTCLYSTSTSKEAAVLCVFLFCPRPVYLLPFTPRGAPFPIRSTPRWNGRYNVKALAIDPRLRVLSYVRYICMCVYTCTSSGPFSMVPSIERMDTLSERWSRSIECIMWCRFYWIGLGRQDRHELELELRLEVLGKASITKSRRIYWSETWMEGNENDTWREDKSKKESA